MTSSILPTVSRTAPARSGEVSGFSGGVVLRAADTVINWLQRDRDRRSLQTLDDRLLRDIGVSRSDVEHEVAKPFWRS